MSYYSLSKKVLTLVLIIMGMGTANTVIAITYLYDIDEKYFYEHPMDDLIDVNNLQSRPGAKNCLYISNGARDQYGYVSWVLQNRMEILITFNSVAEDYYPFDVNITTSQAVYNSYAPGNRSYGVYNHARKGRALVSTFGNGSDLAVATYGPGIKTPQHELGHVIGLLHDGDHSSYLEGEWPLSAVMGSSISKNAPIESNSYVESPLSHWYNGYHGGDSSVDDIAYLGNVLGFVPDDHPVSQPLFIEADGTVIPENNPGGIQSRTDTDEWSFTLDREMRVNFTVKPNAIRSPNLFVGVEIIDSHGTSVAIGQPHGIYGLESAINNVTLPAGDYYLIIDGIAPPTTWFTDYSSFGPYRISGTLLEQSSPFFNAAIPLLLL